jgi:hypothetical protein
LSSINLLHAYAYTLPALRCKAVDQKLTEGASSYRPAFCCKVNKENSFEECSVRTSVARMRKGAAVVVPKDIERDKNAPSSVQKALQCATQMQQYKQHTKQHQLQCIVQQAALYRANY